jgi:glucokinase
VEIVVADIGGTHARFAIVVVDGGRVVELGSEIVLKAASHVSLQTAWMAFGEAIGRPLPSAAAIAVACPVGSPYPDTLKLTNNPWTIRPAQIAEQLGLDHCYFINDFFAVAHAVAQIDDSYLATLCGPDTPIAANGVVSVIGPGTGLGVATLIRDGEGTRVVATEGGHGDFAPLDLIDDQLLTRLRARHGRVSVERVVAGPALVDLYTTLAAIEGRAVRDLDATALWSAALTDDDDLVAAALERFCLCLGAVAGDIALTQGGFGGVVVAGGIGLRLAKHLPTSGFSQRFVAKGRFESLMATVPVKILTHPQPGLLGAAAAFALEHR